MFQIKPDQIHELEDLLGEDAWTYISASQTSQNSFYVLKAINDEIKASGVDWQYDLNEKGKKLQQLYEDLYAANEENQPWN